jgi:hypothetical protein
LKFFGEATEVIPTYQVMNMEGEVAVETEDPKVTLVFVAVQALANVAGLQLPAETMLKMYRTMVELFNTDQILYDLQR